MSIAQNRSRLSFRDMVARAIPGAARSAADEAALAERRAARYAKRHPGNPKPILVHDASVIPRAARRPTGRGFATGARKPARPSGVALASPTSRRGKAQRAGGAA